MKIRTMTPSDAPAAARLLKVAYEPSLRPYITHTQDGIGTYLRAHLEEPALFQKVDMLVAEHEGNGSIIGFAKFEVAYAESTSHLSYICVDPTERGRGIGTALIRQHSDRHQMAAMTLDVFEQNVAARRLYDRLGFRLVAERAWFVRSLPPASTPATVLNGYEAAACHMAYGFSNIRVTRTRSNDTVIGRMGDTVLRCSSVDDFEDDTLLASVRASVPAAKEALLIALNEERPPSVARQRIITRTHRLRLDYRASKHAALNQ